MLAVLVLAGGEGALADEVQRGEVLFRSCRSCHSLDPGQQGMAGPSLDGLAGRLLGSAWGFDYSPGFRAARTQGLRWDAERLKAYLGDPDSVVPGGWMSPPGGLGEADRAALAAFLLSR
ncbi:c-type cytochrome [Bosea sp. (in: a-proteobacteria)]|uniref:c-type cytochrome n=1 Tax=Bosea sp. (in: a-proteobacteria) TaxID=1871050 RepID=UPI002FC7D3B9